MIQFIVGDNSFEVERMVKSIIDRSSVIAEIIDGEELTLAGLPDLLMGSSLFSDSRLVIIKNLSDNKSLWAEFGGWVDRISDDIELVIVEPNPDKRTATFKALKSSSKYIELPMWTERDRIKAQNWLMDEAKLSGVELNKKSVQRLIDRVGVNQWNLFHALEKLSLIGAVTDEVIDEVVDLNPNESVFNLFDTAMRGDVNKLSKLLSILKKTEDPFRLFALLTSQAFQVAVAFSSGSDDTPTKDFVIHPYVYSKLSHAAKRLGKSGVTKVINIFAEADDDMKVSRGEPWELIERALIKVANI